MKPEKLDYDVLLQSLKESNALCSHLQLESVKKEGEILELKIELESLYDKNGFYINEISVLLKSNKDLQSHIAELESGIKDAIESINDFQDGGCSKNIKDAKHFLQLTKQPK